MIFKFNEIYKFLKNKKIENYKNKINIKINLTKTYANNICDDFINRICEDKLNKIIFYGMNSKFNFDELTTIIIYRKTISNFKKDRFIIMLIAVHPKVRNLGYGKLTINNFINYFYKKNKILEIFLHSLNTSLNFYINLGFKKIKKNNFIINYEGIKNEKNLHFLRYLK